MSSRGAGRDPTEQLDRFEAELAEQLLRDGELDAADLERARKVQARTGSRLTTALLDLGLVPAERIQQLRTQLQGAPARPSDEELISQGSFEDMYHGGQSALPPAGRSRPLGPGEVRTPVQRDLPPMEGLEPRTPPASAPKPAAATSEPEAPLPPLVQAPPVEGDELELLETVGQWSGDSTGPITAPSELTEARRQLAEAGDRKQVGWVLARHALGKAPRVVVLARRGRAWIGWAGAGAGIRNERVERLVVPPVPGTLFGLVASTGGHYLGPLAAHPVHERFFRTLGVEPAASVGLFPVHHDGNIEMALYLDAGPGGQLSSDVGEVLLIAQEVPRTLARLAAAAGR